MAYFHFVSYSCGLFQEKLNLNRNLLRQKFQRQTDAEKLILLPKTIFKQPIFLVLIATVPQYSTAK